MKISATQLPQAYTADLSSRDLNGQGNRFQFGVIEDTVEISNEALRFNGDDLILPPVNEPIDV